jgi:hypothetical protein
MPYIVALLIGLVAGRLSGGRFAHLGRLHLRWLWLVAVALVIQLLIFPLVSGKPLLPYGTAALHLTSYALLIVWMAMNVHVVPIRGLLLGAACNIAAVAANGGYMPASITALQRAGFDGTAARLLGGETVANVTLMSSSTHLNALGDWLYFPEWIPFSTPFSIGDVFIMISLTWLVVWGMRRHA